MRYWRSVAGIGVCTLLTGACVREDDSKKTTLTNIIPKTISSVHTDYGAGLTTVLLSNREIVAGEEFTTENCRVTDWPVPFVPESHVSSLREVAGKVALGPIPSNSVIASTVTGKIVSPINPLFGSR